MFFHFQTLGQQRARGDNADQEIKKKVSQAVSTVQKRIHKVSQTVFDFAHIIC